MVFPLKHIALGGIILLSACTDCRRSEKPRPGPDTIQASPDTTARQADDWVGIDSALSSFDLRQDSSCRKTKDTLACATASGGTARFVSWSIPEGPGREGDKTAYRYRGMAPGLSGSRVVEVELGHDAPMLLLVDSAAPRWIELHPWNGQAFHSRSRKAIAIVSESDSGVSSIRFADSGPVEIDLPGAKGLRLSGRSLSVGDREGKQSGFDASAPGAVSRPAWTDRLPDYAMAPSAADR